jgi:hypothetical protein
MVMILYRTGVNQPSSLRKGTFSNSTKLDSKTNESISMQTDSYTDFFKMVWPSGNYISEASNNTVKAAAENITRLYSDKYKLINLTTTTDILFLAASQDFQQFYAEQLITELYSNISHTLERSYMPNNSFTIERMKNLDFNKEKFYPNLAVISGTYRYKEFGFDIPKICNKCRSWVKYAAYQDPDLLDYFNNNFKEMIDHFTSYFTEDYFLDAYGNVYLNLTNANFKNNLTLTHILITSLIADLGMFSEDKLTHALPKGGSSLVFETYKFLQYEYLQYNNLYSLLQMAPFFTFMYDEFNLMMKYLNGWTISDIKPGNFDRKMILFSLYSETFTSFFKFLNLDTSILLNEKYQLISQFNSWDEKLRNATKLKVMPEPLYGSSIHLELISEIHPDNPKLKLFYIGLRKNYEDEYIFVLPIADFNNLIGLILIDPPLTGSEMEFYCGTVTE